ncbi:polysaccharide pyruvyl transferase family protein [Qipengyuania flava]|nr:polysaccharide pyruvyl transferase family protein [Qipengyuania flava]
MKVGLLTYHFSDNYGALYQAFGLRQWFIDRGHDAEFINYHPSYVEEGGPLDRPWKPSLWRKNATIAYMWASHIQRNLLGDRAQKRGFEAFRRTYLGATGRRLKTAEDLGSVVGRYDLLVCGSDQIWNPSIQRGLDPVYFLAIPGSEDVRKIAYAPSFGRTSIESEHLGELHALASQLDGISVREETGLGILADAGISPERVHVVPDPTILLGNFDMLARKKAPSDEVVFCYALRTDEVIRDVAGRVAAKLELPLVSARSSRQRWSDIGEGISPTPVEWLQSLANSAFVVSNSFHGVALSVIHRKPFIAVKLPGKRAGMNARVENLLDQIGLSWRLVDADDVDNAAKLVDMQIDWDAVGSKLTDLRSTGELFLQSQSVTVAPR